MTIPQYGYWGDKGRGKPEVIESSDDLKDKYNVSKDRVILLKTSE